MTLLIIWTLIIAATLTVIISASVRGDRDTIALTAVGLIVAVIGLCSAIVKRKQSTGN